MTRQLLEHSGLLLLVWTLGLAWSMRLSLRRGPWPAAPGLICFGVLVTWFTAALFTHGGGPTATAQWMAIALLVLSRRPLGQSEHSPLGLSLLPLVLLSWQGFWALLAAVVVAGSGALESGQRRRAALMASVVALSMGSLVDSRSLSLWIWLGSTFDLSPDRASTLVNLLEQVPRGLGWLCLLRWLDRDLWPPGPERADP